MTGDKKDWEAFNRLMSEDTTNDPVFRIFDSMFISNWDEEYSVRSIGTPILVSGRSCEFRKQTVHWILERLSMYPELGAFSEINKFLYMRNKNDFRPDEIVKKEILDQIRKDYPSKNIIGVFDDRPKVIRMWRDNGIFVFDCSQGAEDF